MGTNRKKGPNGNDAWFSKKKCVKSLDRAMKAVLLSGNPLNPYTWDFCLCLFFGFF